MGNNEASLYQLIIECFPRSNFFQKKERKGCVRDNKRKKGRKEEAESLQCMCPCAISLALQGHPGKE